MNAEKEMEITFGHKFQLLREAANRSESETSLLLRINLFTYLRLEADVIYPREGLITKIGRLYGLSYQEMLDLKEKDFK